MHDPLDHKGLIYKELAKRYATPEEKKDMAQEAWEIIIKKIPFHDPKRGAMSSYLITWIRYAFQHYLAKSNMYGPYNKAQQNEPADINLSYLYHDETPEAHIEGMQEAHRITQEYIKDYKKRRPKSRRTSKFKDIEKIYD